MKEPLILSGKDVSAHVYDSLLERIKKLSKKKCTPGLAVVLVGENPASQVYVRSKTRIFKKSKTNYARLRQNACNFWPLKNMRLDLSKYVCSRAGETLVFSKTVASCTRNNMFSNGF